MRFLIIIGTVLLFCSFLKAEESEEIWVKKIYEKLYQTKGDFSRPMPSIEISDRVFNIAAYRKKSKQLIIEQQAIDVCKSLGEQSETALAFLIGHELTHFYQNHEGGFAFLMTQENFASQILVEKEADIYGAMLTYLAGYKEIVEVLPNLIEALYVDYQLDDEKMVNYPSKEKRKQLISEVTVQVQSLIQVYETAKYLGVAGQHSYAGDLYNHITKFVVTKEILNNQAVAYLSAAALITEYGKKDWAYPLIIDRTNPMRIPSGVQKQILLKRAKAKLNLALQYDPNYFESKLNHVVALTMQEKYAEALAGLSEASDLAQKQQEILSTRLLRGIILAQKGDKKASIKLFESVKKSGNDGLSQLANINLQLVLGKTITAKRSTNGFRSIQNRIDNINLNSKPRMNDGYLIKLNENPFNPQKLSIKQLDNSTLCLLETLEKSLAVQFTRQGVSMGIGQGTSIQTVKSKYKAEEARIIPHNKDGFFMEFPKLGLIFLFDTQEKVEEWAIIAYY